jgi:hypothetical protein
MRMKNLGRTGAMAIAATLSIAGCATAQTPPAQNMTNMGQLAQKLNKLSNENSAILHRNYGPPPPQSSIPPTPYTAVPGFWKCMSVVPTKKIHSQPSSSSRSIGITFGWIAAGPDVDGFTKVYYHLGKIGYVNSKYVSPFYDKYAPTATCTFKGVQPNGVDLFDVRTPQ